MIKNQKDASHQITLCVRSANAHANCSTTLRSATLHIPGTLSAISNIITEQRNGEMAHDLNERLKQWLQQLAKERRLTIEQVALGITADEIHNRESAYPKICIALSTLYQNK